MFSLSYLTEPDAMPDFIPRRRSLVPRTVFISNGGGISVAQDVEGEAAQITVGTGSRTSVEVGRAEPVPTDPFRFMDFRVSWDGATVSIRAGRVHTIQWSPPVVRFIASSYVIPADTLPLVLTEGQENRIVYLSIPWAEHGDTAFLPAGTPPWPDTVQHQDPDGGFIYDHAYWSGFSLPEYSRRVALPAGAPKFAWTDHDGDNPVDQSDNQIAIATIGFTTGVQHNHFGSVFLRSGFDVART